MTPKLGVGLGAFLVSLCLDLFTSIWSMLMSTTATRKS